MKAVLLLVLLSFCGIALSQTIPDQDWGYVTVRPQAHMFWWLYGKQDVSTRATAPLILWLQGGPGASSTGYGNFEEIGPLDVNLRPRNATWASLANLIFVDNPVGTGYSYVESSSAYTTNEDQISADLVALFKAFFQKYPIFQKSPFYIFSESYGGKMAASFALALVKAANQSQISVNFKAVALGDSWIDPIKFVDAWIPYLEATSEIDPSDQVVGPVWNTINQTHQALANGQYTRATNLWGDVENQISDRTAGVSWYNILDRTGDDNLAATGFKGYLKLTSADPLTTLMNGPLKQKLGIPSTVTWGGQSNNVFSALSADFMQSVVPTVDSLLDSGVQVVVYSGNLDLICCTPGTLAWINELEWSGRPIWYNTARTNLMVNGLVGGYEKTYKNLRFFFIFGSGHMVPTDQPDSALQMVKKITNLN